MHKDNFNVLLLTLFGEEFVCFSTVFKVCDVLEFLPSVYLSGCFLMCKYLLFSSFIDVVFDFAALMVNGVVS
ncbi:hypothetical protein AB6E04_20235 [Vibrio amylolyticus]|uniref:hypothetical protein n=1 Tax=Vibrio amylolyticus TaxID=2847292 RepID=UPI0035503E77